MSGLVSIKSHRSVCAPAQIAVTAFCLLSPFAAVHPNLRAPFILSMSPSSAVGTDAGLRVLSERLIFDCGGFSRLRSSDIPALTQNPSLAGKCRITAIYKIGSRLTLHASFQFLLPADAAVRVTANAKTVIQNIRPDRILDPANDSARFSRLFQTRTNEIFNARFDGDLASGENEIQIEYDQILSAQEYDYGYFSSGQFARSFQYFLWPLKEWISGENFSIVVEVRTPRPGILTRIFGTTYSVKCDAHPDLDTTEGSTRSMRYTFHAEFPDVLSCSFTED